MARSSRRSAFSKSKSKTKTGLAAKFDEQKHKRDSSGRFADKPGAGNDAPKKRQVRAAQKPSGKKIGMDDEILGLEGGPTTVRRYLSQFDPKVQPEIKGHIVQMARSGSISFRRNASMTRGPQGREMRNGVERPRPGGRMAQAWDVLDRQPWESGRVTWQRIDADAQTAGLLPGGVRAEYTYWNRFNGGANRVGRSTGAQPGARTPSRTQPAPAARSQEEIRTNPRDDDQLSYVDHTGEQQTTTVGQYLSRFSPGSNEYNRRRRLMLTNIRNNDMEVHAAPTQSAPAPGGTAPRQVPTGGPVPKSSNPEPKAADQFTEWHPTTPEDKALKASILKGAAHLNADGKVDIIWRVTGASLRKKPDGSAAGQEGGRLFSFRLRHPEGKLSVERSFEYDHLGAPQAVDHSYFTLDQSLRGAGTKEFLSETVAAYQKAGFKQVDVHANIDVGGYAWLKYGFTPRGSDRTSLASRAKYDIEGKVRRGDISEADGKAYTALADAGDVHALSDTPHGKDFFKGTNWYGKLDLQDEQSMRRFFNYAKPKTKG